MVVVEFETGAKLNWLAAFVEFHLSKGAKGGASDNEPCRSFQAKPVLAPNSGSMGLF
jgi:hypothetical protein